MILTLQLQRVTLRNNERRMNSFGMRARNKEKRNGEN